MHRLALFPISTSSLNAWLSAPSQSCSLWKVWCYFSFDCLGEIQNPIGSEKLQSSSSRTRQCSSDDLRRKCLALWGDISISGSYNSTEGQVAIYFCIRIWVQREKYRKSQYFGLYIYIYIYIYIWLSYMVRSHNLDAWQLTLYQPECMCTCAWARACVRER